MEEPGLSSVLLCLVEPDAVDDGPDVTDDDTGEEELQDAEHEGVALESVAKASGEACADARGEWDAVQDQADESEGAVKGHDSISAAVFGLLSFVHLMVLFIF